MADDARAADEESLPGSPGARKRIKVLTGGDMTRIEVGGNIREAHGKSRIKVKEAKELSDMHVKVLAPVEH